MTEDTPDYILATPQKDDIPRIEASCNSADIGELRELQQKGQRIYKLVRGYMK